MAYDPQLAARIRAALAGHPGLVEKAMFGGIVFMLDGHMCCGVAHEELMLRLGEPGATAALNEPHTRPMDFTGKPLKTMIFVDQAGLGSDEVLAAWIERAASFARTLPPK